MKSAELRSLFLEFFQDRGHTVVPSSPLVPVNDPTLLFTNAGMVQFKDTFLGRERRPYTRATSSQRCVRAGGKHNDLENVGYTARHHTFFEMLGNFSFGDYFKREAIFFAWEFLTVVLKLPPARLWVTVYEQDEEAADVWLDEIKIDSARFRRIGATDNFWSMGDIGPCGPCTEIFYDHGPGIAGGPPGGPEGEGDRYVEIWNLVFMQYNREADGALNDLPDPSVDTGMGLERLAAVMQGVHDNYRIDLFQKLIKAAAKIADTVDLEQPSLKVIADHIRSCSFLIADGVLPSNEGRGYVLRRIIRRAARHGHKLGVTEPFFYKLVPPLAEEMGGAYPELMHTQEQVEKVLRQEETRFAETLELGLRILDEDVARISGSSIPGETVFRLYDTYGFPPDLTNDIARERGLTLDMAGFEREMAGQRQRAQAASRFKVGDFVEAEMRSSLAPTEFTGYDRVRDEGKVIALYRDGEPVERLEQGDEGIVILARTPFYAEAGGQVGDTGELRVNPPVANAATPFSKGGEENAFALEKGGPGGIFQVRDTRKQGKMYVHIGAVASGRIAIGDTVEAAIDAARRQAIRLNHSATHLLHAALRQVLGTHVLQKGSLVAPDRLRFDFSHSQPVTQDELAEIEQLVNDRIRLNAQAETRLVALDEAMASGAMALFGEKYDDPVRVLSLGEFSTELCGGTHVVRAGDIGFFKIVQETGVAAGIRRIEALTGEAAVAWVENVETRLDEIAGLVRAGRADVNEKVRQLMERSRALEKQLTQLQAQLAASHGADLAAQAVEVEGIKVLATRLDGVDVKALRTTLDQLKNKLGKAAIVLAAVDGEKVNLVAGVTKGQTERLKAGDLVNAIAREVGGKGGGRPDLAQGGGNNPAALEGALRSVPEWVRTHMRAGEE